MILRREVATIPRKVKPHFGFFGLTEGVAQAVLEDGFMSALGKSFCNIAADRPR
jgi:hypothetical protein